MKYRHYMTSVLIHQVGKWSAVKWVTSLWKRVPQNLNLDPSNLDSSAFLHIDYLHCFSITLLKHIKAKL